jgi:hypothetical protein
MTDAPDDIFSTDDPDSLIDSINDLYAQNQEVLEAIHLLESELENVEDPVGMYITLFDLYSELENMQEAGLCLVEASRRVSADAHSDLAFFLYNQLELFAQLSPEAQDAYERLGHLIAGDQGDFDPNTVHLDQRKLTMSDFIPEILLAQHLMRSKTISQSEYQVVIQDLCWCGSKEQTTPRSCLYVLHDRELPHEEKAIEFLAHDASTPFLDLTLVDPDPDLMDVLPPESCVRRAACVFGEVGGEPMVALLNPFNLQLKDDIARRLECDPHFFLTHAAGYSHFLELQRRLAEK